MKIVTYVLLTISFCFMLSSSFAIMISEINFRGDEFVEIVLSNSSIINSFNESYFIVDNFKSTNNTFSLYNFVENSTILVIAGENFISNNQDTINELGCTIYQTDRSQVGFGGLSVNGEAFTIYFNSNLSIEYLNEHTPSTIQGESVHFNTTSTFVSNHSACELNQFQQKLFNETTLISEDKIDSNDSISNISDSNESSSSISNDTIIDEDVIVANCELYLDVDQIIEDTRIQFTFSGNTSLGVTYYIEDGVGNIVRNPFTSSTATPKSYTPRKNGKFIVYGFIDDENCDTRVGVNATTFFYNPELDIDADTSSSSSSRIPRVEEDTFLNIFQVLQHGLNQVTLVGEVSRGNSNAYRLGVYVNNERVSQYDVKRYGHFDFQIPLQLESGENTIELRGFSLRESVTVTMPDVEDTLEEKIIMLLHEKGLLGPNRNSEFTQSQAQIQSTLQGGAFSNQTSEFTQATLTNSTTNTTTPNSELVYSKHFFNQNLGVVLIVTALVLIAGIIIALR